MGIFTRRKDAPGLKKFYNWFYKFYGLIEANIGPTLDQALEILDPQGTAFQGRRVLEWACGSGELTRRLAARGAQMTAVDQSNRMLVRARQLWGLTRSEPPPFFEGDIHQPGDLEAGAQDVVLSFALHLFPLKVQKQFLARWLKAGVQRIFIIDHPPRWTPVVALAEWIEGSHWDEFIKIDWQSWAQDLKAGLRIHHDKEFLALEIFPKIT